jgi:hypothetical protein
MRTIERPVATACVVVLLAMAVGASPATAGDSPCLQSVEQALVDAGGGLRTGRCPDLGQFVMVTVEGDAQAGAEAFELMRAEALRDLSSFFESDVQATEVLEEWERVRSDGEGGESVEYGSDYSARTESSTQSLLRGLQFHSQTDVGNRRYVSYLLSASSITVADELGELMAVGAEPGPEGEERPVAVVATGLAPVEDDDVAAARDAAIDRARDQAIGQVLGVVVGSTVDAVDFEEVRSEVFAHSVGFVDRYEVLDEGREGDVYRARIRATVTANKLYDGYQAYLQQMESPLFLVDAAGDRTLAEPFAGFVADLGIELTDDEQAASYVVRLRCDYESVVHPIEKVEGTRARLTIAVHRADDGVELFSHANDPRKAVSFLSDARRRIDLVVGDAFDDLREDFHRSLNELIVDMARNGRRINAYFDIRDAACRDAYLQLARDLDGQGGVRKAAITIDDTRDLYVLRMRYIGDGAELAERIRSQVAGWSCTNRSPRIAYMSASEIWFSTRSD